jgi:pimeloyl-ACP methyl ester carboxylesterase
MATLELADGRRLAYEEWGDPAGRPVLFQHGTGDSRLARHPDDSLTAAAGVRLITADRPGVGGSDRAPHRRLLDWPAYVAALADALGIASFAVAGWSGGGPHALAIARQLGDRVTRVALASPLGPFDRPGSRDLVENRDLRMIWSLSHAKWVAGLAGRLESRGAVHDLRRFVASIAKDAPADAGVLGDPELEPMFETEMGEALAQHGAGVLDDMWAFLDWGFAPEEVSQSVELFYGDADEILSPRMYRELGDRLGDCRVHPWAGGGHYALFAHWPELLAATA